MIFRVPPFKRAITSDFQHWPIIFFLEMCKVMIEESKCMVNEKKFDIQTIRYDPP